MNNGEKYLKKGIKEEFIKKINEELDISFDQFNIELWLETPYKPIITKEETSK